MLVESLDGKAVEILYFLHRMGKANIGKISLETGMSVSTIYRVLIVLIKLGLIIEERRKNARILSLTTRGKNVVKLLYALDYYLQGEEGEARKILSDLLERWGGMDVAGATSGI